MRTRSNNNRRSTCLKIHDRSYGYKTPRQPKEKKLELQKTIEMNKQKTYEKQNGKTQNRKL